MNALKGKKALVTGASRGIGFAIAEAFAREGAEVMAVSSGESIEAVAREIAKKTGVAVRALRADLTDETQITAVAKACREAFGKLDVLVNNAGVLEAAPLGMITAASLKKHFETNVFSMIHLTQYASRFFSASASVVNLTSIAGVHGSAGLAAYAASKAAVVGFTLSAAKELGPRGVRVNAIAPGFIDTDMTRRACSEEVRAAMVKRTSLGRMGRPEDVAGAAVYLASGDASFVTGLVLGVDGGLS